jgi:hypothetical protein
VRGTVFVVEVDPMQPGQSGGGPATTTRVHLFHGALDVSARLDPGHATVQLAELQSVVVAGNALGPVRPISRDAVAALTADLKPREVQTPDAPSEFTGGLVAREQGRAVMLATALLAPAPVPGALTNVKGTVSGVTGAVTNVTGATAEALENLMDQLGFEAIGDTVSGLGSTVGGLTNALGGTVTGLGGAVGGLTGGVGGSLGGTVAGVGGTLGGVGGTLGGTAGGLGGTVGGLSGTLGGTVGTLGGTVGTLGGTVGGTVGGSGGTVGGVVGGLVGGLGGLLGGGR